MIPTLLPILLFSWVWLHWLKYISHQLIKTVKCNFCSYICSFLFPMSKMFVLIFVNVSQILIKKKLCPWNYWNGMKSCYDCICSCMVLFQFALLQFPSCSKVWRQVRFLEIHAVKTNFCITLQFITFFVNILSKTYTKCQIHIYMQHTLTI